MAKKQTYYFQHDFNPTTNLKIQAMIGEFGAIGYGLYWRITEMLHTEEDHKLKRKTYVYLAIAQQMGVDVKVVKDFVTKCIGEFELFDGNDDYIFADRVFRNIKAMEDKKEQRVQAGKASAEARKNQQQEAEADASEEGSADQRDISEEQDEPDQEQAPDNDSTLVEQTPTEQQRPFNDTSTESNESSTVVDHLFNARSTVVQQNKKEKEKEFTLVNSKKENSKKEKLKIPENKFSVDGNFDFSENGKNASNPECVEAEEISDSGKSEESPPKKSSAKKSPPKLAHPAHSPIKAIWFEEVHPSWIFRPIDGQKINSIIKQLAAILKAQNREDTPQEIESAFRAICQNLPDWYKTKDLSIIDSKLNSIIAEIKTKHHEPAKPNFATFRGGAYAQTERSFD